MTKFLFKKLTFLLCVFSLTHSCRDKDAEPAIGDSISTPVSLATDASGQYFYVLNADFLHNYKTGSILTLDQSGNKLSALEVPHLGKVLTVSGNDMLVAFDHESDETLSKTVLYNIANPQKPVRIKEWESSSCTPANIVSRSGYPYFALSCQEGDLYIGTLAPNREASTLTRVRSYPTLLNSARRALYIDPKRGLLFMFLTDTGTGNLTDAVDADAQTWLNGLKISDVPDEIPDSLQQTEARAQDVLKNTSRFQFIVYDINAAVLEKFPYKNFDTIRNIEPRWLYFSLNNFDGTPDQAKVQGDPNLKSYRTNFWEAQPDPDDLDSFYLSHRGLGTKNHSEHANDLVKVTFIGSPLVSNGIVPKLGTYMSFQRVYGFKGDQTGSNKYFNSFKITKFSGRKVALLNSFRDLSNFSNPRYTLVGANLVEGANPVEWWTQASSDDTTDSYFDLALGSGGNLLTISFFDETLKLFNVKFGENMTLTKSIE